MQLHLSYPSFTSEQSLDTLVNICTLEEHERFSGTIKYKISFVLEDYTCDIMIDLGRVYEIAEVTLNGVLNRIICPNIMIFN